MSNRNQFSFDFNPTNVDIPRSKFTRDSSLLTSFNTADIIPIFVDNVLPGDSYKMKSHKVIRLQTPITPFMGNLYLDTYFFFVPYRLVWEHWKQFNGENTASAWTPSVEYTIPQIEAPENGWNVGTLADYFGLPTGVDGISVSALPFRAYALVINDWFRDQNLQDPLNIPLGDSTVTGVNSGTFVTDVVKGGLPYHASKYRDYFTSCLPAPQKGPDIGIGLSGTAPVYGDGNAFSLIANNSTVTNVAKGSTGASGVSISGNAFNSYEGMRFINGQNTHLVMGVPEKSQLATGSTAGLIADLSNASAVTINSLRLAFAMQRLFEKDARGGTRYIEVIKAHFGVTSPDARQQRPEYLGGNRIPICVNQAVQLSSTNDTSPLGDTGAFSLTTDSNFDFEKSFTEHGLILGLAVARYDHVYQQGIERFWSRKDRFDFYWPSFANIGEQAVLNKEIYADGSSTDEEVFGYQEAWADYRYKPSRVTGEMRSAYATSLDVWHLADDYSACPSLSDSWIQEDKSNVDRVLAVQSSVSNQFFGDFYFELECVRPMPLHSIPGLIDHH